MGDQRVVLGNEFVDLVKATRSRANDDLATIVTKYSEFLDTHNDSDKLADTLVVTDLIKAGNHAKMYIESLDKLLDNF